MVQADSERFDRTAKAAARAEAKRKTAALNCAQKLEAAAKALKEFMTACNDCEDASGVRGIDDSRVILVGNISEYANFLRSKFQD